MRFSKVETKKLKLALTLAIDYEESYMDSYRTKLVRRQGNIHNVVPAEHSKVVTRIRRNISYWQRLLKKIDTNKDRGNPR